MKFTILNNSDKSNINDGQLWIELKKGNPDALKIFFYRFYDDLYFYGTRLINDNNLIVDTIQDVFTNLWEDRKRLSDVVHVKAYLFKIFRNKLRKAPYKKISIFSMDNNKLPETEFIISQEDIIIERETKSEISQIFTDILENLTDKQKEMLYLKFYCNLSNNEISQILSIEKQSVYNLLNRSLNALRKNLKNYDRPSFSYSPFDD